MAIHIKDKADFDAKIKEVGDKLVVVDFFATWCGPCQVIGPVLEDLAVSMKDSIVVLKEDFDMKISEAGELLVVIDFYATWCGPCKMIAPKLEKLAEELKDTVIVLKVDVDECEDIATEYDISSMPTFIFLKNKEVVSSFSGANYEKLKQLVTDNK